MSNAGACFSNDPPIGCSALERSRRGEKAGACTILRRESLNSVVTYRCTVTLYCKHYIRESLCVFFRVFFRVFFCVFSVHSSSSTFF